MPDPTIRAALDVAGEAVRQAISKPPCCMEGTGCELPPCHCSRVAAAAAVAAFWRMFPDATILLPAVHSGASLAAAVEAEAGDA